MPALYDYRIFISHAWKYGEDYDRLVSMLDHSPWFSFYNYSAPQEKPLALSSGNATDAEIEQAITAKIKNAQVVLVIGGMYELYHKLDEIRSRRSYAHGQAHHCYYALGPVIYAG